MPPVARPDRIWCSSSSILVAPPPVARPILSENTHTRRTQRIREGRKKIKSHFLISLSRPSRHLRALRVWKSDFMQRSTRSDKRGGHIFSIAQVGAAHRLVVADRLGGTGDDHAPGFQQVGVVGQAQRERSV